MDDASAVTNNDLLSAIQATHGHLQSVARAADKVSIRSTPIDSQAFVDEYLLVESGTSASLTPNADSPFMITSFIVVVPSTATGMLTLGGRSIPVTSGITHVNGIAMIIYPNDPINLAVSAAGAVYIEIMGNVLTGDDWRKV